MDFWQSFQNSRGGFAELLTTKAMTNTLQISIALACVAIFAGPGISQETAKYDGVLKQIEVDLSNSTYEDATNCLKLFLQSPEFAKLEETQKIAFFQSLNKLFKAHGRESDASAAEEQAVERISEMDVTCAAAEFSTTKKFESVLADINSGKTSIFLMKPGINAKAGSISMVATLGNPTKSKAIIEKLQELSTLTPEIIQTLRSHAVTTSKSGLLCADGIIGSSPEQIDAIFRNIEKDQQRLNSSRKTQQDIVIYAHGGLTSEADALKTAATQLSLWKKHNIYPIFLIWKSGLEEMVADSTGMRFLEQTQPNGKSITTLAQLPSIQLPLHPDVADSLIESYAKGDIRELWLKMKVKALDSYNKKEMGNIDWSKPLEISKSNGGGSLILSRLKEFAKRYPHCKIHLVGHSAGSVVVAAAIDNMINAGLGISSVHLLAPAITVAQFRGTYLPHLANQKLNKLYIYNLSDELEQKDSVTAGLLKYHKSLLYLVSRALEWGGGLSSEKEIPILGMSKFFSQQAWPGTSRSLRDELIEKNTTIVLSPPPPSNATKCNARSHGGFGSEPITLNSIVLNIEKQRP